MSLSKPQEQQQPASPGSPTKEELEELAARSNAVIEKGLHQLEEEEGTKPLGTATSLAAQHAPRDPDGELYSRTWSEALGPEATKLVKGKVEVEYAGDDDTQQRSEGDTLLRDVNRDRLMGLLTERAAKTLLFYFSELNPTLMQWLEAYIKASPIPTEGPWEDVSGETFLRRLLSMPLEETRWNFGGREAMYAKSSPLGVDPRQIAQRIMEIRGQIAKEWIEELKQVDEENALLMRETMTTALRLGSIPVVDPSQVKGATHPELLHPDFE